jgi:hypothetical protein
VRLLEMARSLVRSALILLIAMLAFSTAQPQEENPRNGAVVDPEIDPKPFDPRYELREYFRTHLSGGWWASEPTYNLSMFTVLLHAPKRWRGNPNSAIGNLCPGPNHPVWKGLKAFAVQAFYEQHTWPEVICRP